MVVAVTRERETAEPWRESEKSFPGPGPSASVSRGSEPFSGSGGGVGSRSTSLIEICREPRRGGGSDTISAYSCSGAGGSTLKVGSAGSGRSTGVDAADISRKLGSFWVWNWMIFSPRGVAGGGGEPSMYAALASAAANVAGESGACAEVVGVEGTDADRKLASVMGPRARVCAGGAESELWRGGLSSALVSREGSCFGCCCDWDGALRMRRRCLSLSDVLRVGAGTGVDTGAGVGGSGPRGGGNAGDAGMA